MTKTMDVVAMVMVQCIMVLLMLNMSLGRTVPSSERQSRGRTLDSCPPQCSCFNRTIACHAMQLSTMPSKLPVRTKVLMLNDNLMETLDWTTLSELTELEELHLRGNGLKGIHWKAIALLPSLRLLDLSDNPIVCDCVMSKLVNGDQESLARLKVQLGETRCAGPPQHAGARARDVLLGMDCRQRTGRRKRSEDHSCDSWYCKHGGTCEVRDSGPVCNCPSSYSGEKCEIRNPSGSTHGSSSGDNILSIFLEDIGHDKIKVSWRVSSSDQIEYYEVSLGYADQSGVLTETKVIQDRYLFLNLRPGTRYEVCVGAYLGVSYELDTKCVLYNTHPPPSGPETGPPSPPHHSNGPDKISGEEDEHIIHKAAVILGSIIGICFFFVIILTAVYKFRKLGNARTRQRRTSPTPEENPEAQPDPQPSPVEATNTTPTHGREIIVLAVSSDNAGPEGDAGASAPETGMEIPASSNNTCSIPLNVLQALKQQGSRNQHGSGSNNTVLLYRPDDRAGGEHRTTSQDDVGGSAPIFIVDGGNSYPLNPDLAEVLRNAMSGRMAPQGAVPSDPPPPYSELAEAERNAPPLEHDNQNNELHSSGSSRHDTAVNREDDMATSEL